MKTIILIITLTFTNTICADDNTECYDPEVLAGWQALLEKYPDDADLKVLFGLRKRLCDQVSEGRTDISEASKRFEQARERLRLKWEEQNRAREMAGGGAG